MERRRVLWMGSALLAGWAIPALSAPPAAGMSLPAAVNKAGRQRMLSQRAAKAWLMVLTQVETDRARKILDASVSLFDRQLGELSSLQPNPEIAAALAQLKSEWEACRAVLAKPPVTEAAPALFKANESVLASAHRLTLAYEKALGGSMGRIIGLAGRQRMLSQRMAKFYFFQRAGVQVVDSKTALDKAVGEFEQAQAELGKAPESTGPVRDELALVDQQWFFFKGALDQSDRSPQAASHVATTSERILEQLDLCVGLYEGMASRSS
ncbi:MAG: type IV pili methyl-accepting chemotaxis transducer N-terminal domain-containing protein [Zoogloeaceae bacterium]|nr:type IV pili methyl-accepting chemotaxis transducer N-terminal domain-containing protein [Zoogloeaceae bacterium]